MGPTRQCHKWYVTVTPRPSRGAETQNFSSRSFRGDRKRKEKKREKGKEKKKKETLGRNKGFDTHFSFPIAPMAYDPKDDVDRLFACFKCGISPPRTPPPPRHSFLSPIQSILVHLDQTLIHWISNAFFSFFCVMQSPHWKNEGRETRIWRNRRSRARRNHMRRILQRQRR